MIQGNEQKATPAPQTKRTRAQVLREKVKVRLALDDAGPEIAAVLKENAIDMPGTYWGKIFPHWLIATVDDEVIGCICVMPAKPFGFLEFLFTKKSAPYKMRILAFRKLLQQGAATLQVAGCSYALGTVEPGNKAFQDVLNKYGTLDAGDVKLMARRLIP